MKIRFKVHHRPKGDAADIPTYKVGETYTFDGPVSEGYARKYIRLGYAVLVNDDGYVEARRSSGENVVIPGGWEDFKRDELKAATGMTRAEIGRGIEELAGINKPEPVLQEPPITVDAAPPDFQRRPGKYRK